MDVDRYLATHFVPARVFAVACGLDEATLSTLVREAALPQPSYVVDGDGVMRSAVFGACPGIDARPDAYFRPSMAMIARRFARALRHRPRDSVLAAAARRFRNEFESAFDAFDRGRGAALDGVGIHVMAMPLDMRSAMAWAAFMDGVFGLCVVDCASPTSIAWKEWLQSRLEHIAAHCGDAILQGQRHALLELIDHYAAAAMPFSPVEYPRSSRYRIVEVLGAQAGRVA